MRNGTYVSADACERADAFALSYQTVCQHPKEVGVLGPEETLVIDFNHVLFDAHDLAVRKATEATRRGVWVGIHTYFIDDPRLAGLRSLPNVLIAKTHRQVLVLMRQPGIHGPECSVEKDLEEVTHVHKSVE